MTLDDAFRILENRTNLEKGFAPGNPNRVYRLDRMRTLCSAFGNPQDSLRIIHIAGSKGKGSTAAYTASLLQSAGRKTGIYSSPHLRDYRERFRIEGCRFPEQTALDTITAMLARLPSVEGELPGNGESTTFELLTLFAFLFFGAAGCDTVVLETGLGGRLDATNVVQHPEAVLLTAIEKEHVEILGTRISSIAAEKAGIMKPGVPAWSGFQNAIVRRTFRINARRKHARLSFLSDSLNTIRPIGSPDETIGNTLGFPWELVWKSGHIDRIQLSMGGCIQAENAALALLTARSIEPALSGRTADGLSENTPFVLSALAKLSQVQLPGRFQRLESKPLIIIDGAHTPRSIEAVAPAFVQIARKNPILLFGCVMGKNHRKMARILCGGSQPLFREVIISTPGYFKPSEPDEVAGSFRRTDADVRLLSDPEEAWTVARKRAGIERDILVCGSFFMAGEIARLHSEENHGRTLPVLPR